MNDFRVFSDIYLPCVAVFPINIWGLEKAIESYGDTFLFLIDSIFRLDEPTEADLIVQRILYTCFFFK